MREEKKLLLGEIKDKMQGSKALVLASYKQLAPNKSAEFRLNLSKTGGSLEVVKKRVLVKAAQEMDVQLDPATLQGHIAVIFADQDPIETTKAVYTFRQENKDMLEVIGGRFEGALVTAADMEAISKLPSQEEMRAQFLGTLEAPMSQTLAVVDALLTSVVYCLENKGSADS